MDLGTELTETYLENGSHAHELIGRGFWIGCNPVEDDLTPETLFSDRRLTYQLPKHTGNDGN